MLDFYFRLQCIILLHMLWLNCRLLLYTGQYKILDFNYELCNTVCLPFM